MVKFSPASLAKIGLLSAIAFILMFFEIQVPIFPEFLKFDLSGVPVVISTLAMGPAAGICTELVKDLLNLTKTTSGGIGEVANFLIGSSLIIPIGILCKKNLNLTNFAIGSVIGVALMVVVACALNYYVLLPMYTKFMPIEAIVEMAKAINKSVVDVKTLLIFSIGPFNLVKGIIITVFSYVLFKALRPVIISQRKAA